MKFISYLSVLVCLTVCVHLSAHSMFFKGLSVDSLKAYPFSYQINQPDESFTLHESLNEISGISLSEDGQHLIGVQDENGRIFFMNKKNGQIEKEVEFHKDGDYEDITIVDGEIFVLKSTGTLYKVADCSVDKTVCTKYNGFLEKDNDVEGLTYDPVNHRLLLACKGDSGIGTNIDLQKSVYAFNLEKQEMEEQPAYVINQASIFNFLSQHPAIEKLESLLHSFTPDNSHIEFCPSAIAVHPLTGDIYVLASIGKMLVILNPAGDVIHIEKLDKTVHRQPEGMVFDKDGTLYISNESKNDPPKIHRFSYQQ